MATTGAYGSGNVNIGATAANVFRPNILGVKKLWDFATLLKALIIRSN